MKTTLGLLALFVLSTACTPKSNEEQTIKIQPVTAAEVRALQISLYTGRPLDEVSVTSSDECQSFQAQLPGDYFKGSVEVPEDYANPTDRKIKVFYYGRLTQGHEPVVFFNGGPAADSHSSSSLFDSLPEADGMSFIYVDQRGTGCSDLFPAEATLENVKRLSHYTSTEIVKDSEVIREKVLGAQTQWKIFGQSYGGLIVHRYSMVAPKSVKAAYAHGFSLMKDQTEWLKLRIASQKRVSELYFKNFPNDRDLLTQIRGQIPETLCFDDGSTHICGAKVMDALTVFLGFSDTWSQMHDLLARLRNAKGELNLKLLETFVRNYVFGVFNSNALAGSVITMTEISDGTSDGETCAKVQDKLTQEGEHPETWLINECRLLSALENNQWKELLKQVDFHGAMTPEDLQTSLQNNPKLPFYLYSGERDVFVPIETYAEEVKVLGSRITYRQFPKTGHEGFYAEPQVWKDLQSVF
jgi:pimeloyl-ACP methyl ester carboxylesterase